MGESTLETSLIAARGQASRFIWLPFVRCVGLILMSS